MNTRDCKFRSGYFFMLISLIIKNNQIENYHKIQVYTSIVALIWIKNNNIKNDKIYNSMRCSPFLI